MSAGVRYLTLDVFTSTPFGGNQLAVFPDATGIPEGALLNICREFNFSETTFCYPPEDAAHTRKVRIFTPGAEVPFAGHPTVGTAAALALCEGALPEGHGKFRFEMGVGTVHVDVRVESPTRAWAELSVAKLPEVGPHAPTINTLAEILSVDASDLMGGAMSPQAVSCGLPFLIVHDQERQSAGDGLRRHRPTHQVARVHREDLGERVDGRRMRSHLGELGHRELGPRARGGLHAHVHVHRPHAHLETELAMPLGERPLAERERRGGAHGRMPGERHLGPRREDPHLPRVRRILRRIAEGRLREVELAADVQQRPLGDPGRVGEDRELVAAEGRGREDVEGEVAHAGAHLASSAMNGYR